MQIILERYSNFLVIYILEQVYEITYWWEGVSMEKRSKWELWETIKSGRHEPLFYFKVIYVPDIFKKSEKIRQM